MQPYLSAFQTYLTKLFRLVTATNLMTALIERYVKNICSELLALTSESFDVKVLPFWTLPDCAL